MINGDDLVQKVYVNQEGVAVMKCPDCGAIKSADVSRLKLSGRQEIKVRCTCQTVYAIRLEFRKTYRKETKLNGEYFVLTGRGGRGQLIVVNLSMGGIGAQIIGANRLQVADELQVSFTLDDRHHSLIKKRVVVRMVNQNYIGCEFLDQKSTDKALGFYLMV